MQTVPKKPWHGRINPCCLLSFAVGISEGLIGLNPAIMAESGKMWEERYFLKNQDNNALIDANR